MPGSWPPEQITRLIVPFLSIPASPARRLSARDYWDAVTRQIASPKAAIAIVSSAPAQAAWKISSRLGPDSMNES